MDFLDKMLVVHMPVWSGLISNYNENWEINLLILINEIYLHIEYLCFGLKNYCVDVDKGIISILYIF